MICIVGGGKMGSAIADALAANSIKVTVVGRGEAPVACDGAIIAVKPKDALAATEAAAKAGAKRIVSVAAGITLAGLQSAAPNVPVVRAMPNLGATVRKSATAIAGDDLDWADETLSALGVVVRVEESMMDAVTGLSGSGPAYVFLVTEALIEAGVSAGLPFDVAQHLSIATLQGAAELLNNQSPTHLREMVTTPAGTTAAGLTVLEERGLRAAFTDAVKAAAQRSHELGS